MPTSVTLAPGSASDVGGGDQSWTDPTYVTANDSNTAVCSLGSGQNSNKLVADAFGFSIPSGATIAGIVATVYKYAMGDAEDLSIRLRGFGGTPAGDDKAATGVFWPGSEGGSAYGTSSDNWSAGFTDTDINSSSFGVQIQATTSTGATVRVQYVEVTVYYSGGATAQPQLLGNPQLLSQTRGTQLQPLGVQLLQAWEPVVVAADTWVPQALVSLPPIVSTGRTSATIYAAPRTETADSSPGWCPQFVTAVVRSPSLPATPTFAIFTPPAGFGPLCACPWGAVLVRSEFATARIVITGDDPYVPGDVNEIADRGPLVTDTSNTARIVGEGGFASAVVIEHCHCG